MNTIPNATDSVKTWFDYMREVVEGNATPPQPDLFAIEVELAMTPPRSKKPKPTQKARPVFTQGEMVAARRLELFHKHRAGNDN